MTQLTNVAKRQHHGDFLIVYQQGAMVLIRAFLNTPVNIFNP